MSTCPVSVLIVNYNSGEWLARCVEAVGRSDTAVEILVGDNHSSDDSIALLEKRRNDLRNCRVFRFEANLGFAAATNRLLHQSSGEFILLLNPDCLVEIDTLSRVLTELRNQPNAGMAGCLIRNMDGSEQRGCRRRIPTLQSAFFRSIPSWLSTRLPVTEGGTRSFDLTDTPLPDEATDMEAISGAFMLITRQAANTVGPMDEGYFLHFEDLDWCQRFRRAGLRILFVPQAVIIHRQGACSEAMPIRVEWYKHCSMLRFFSRAETDAHLGPRYLFIAAAVLGHFCLAITKIVGRRLVKLLVR